MPFQKTVSIPSYFQQFQQFKLTVRHILLGWKKTSNTILENASFVILSSFFLKSAIVSKMLEMALSEVIFFF
jgi:hypothetical protein